MYWAASVMRPSAIPCPRSAACSTWSYWSNERLPAGVKSSTPIASSHAAHDNHGQRRVGSRRQRGWGGGRGSGGLGGGAARVASLPYGGAPGAGGGAAPGG